MQMTSEKLLELETIAEANDGHCDRCDQTIKIYRYKINKSHTAFLRAMAEHIKASGVNDVDISTIGIAYSVRTQVTKMRLHGLIARVKDDRGVQLPRRWLITKKGWAFLNGDLIPEKVVVYNNQVLGHDGGVVSIYTVSGKYDPEQPKYEETPVSQPEARTYTNVRQPKRQLNYQALYKGSKFNYGGLLSVGESYSIDINQLFLGKPVTVTMHVVDNQPPIVSEYPDIAAFQKDWKVM